jgi:hypothetical protein
MAKRSGQGGSSGSLEKDVEWYLVRLGVPLMVALLAVAGVGVLFHKSARQTWEAVAHPETIASGAWRAVQGTRCAVTCPKKTSLDALDKLTVAPEADALTYRRLKFGDPWTDVDHNGCDTRDDILRRDLTDEATRPTKTCRIGAPVTGHFVDPYSGATVTFNKAEAIKVQIDHVVSLGEAWRSGASEWKTPEGKSDSAKLLRYANDPDVLATTTQAINEAKSDHDAAQAWRQCVKRGPIRPLHRLAGRPTHRRPRLHLRAARRDDQDEVRPDRRPERTRRAPGATWRDVCRNAGVGP